MTICLTHWLIRWMLWCIHVAYQPVLIHWVSLWNYSIIPYNTSKPINQQAIHTIIFINIIQVKWVREFLFQWWKIHKLGILLLQALDKLSTKKIQTKDLKLTCTRNKIVKWSYHFSKTIYSSKCEEVELPISQIWLVVFKSKLHLAS
jgi:hypothetical protein